MFCLGIHRSISSTILICLARGAVKKKKKKAKRLLAFFFTKSKSTLETALAIFFAYYIYIKAKNTREESVVLIAKVVTEITFLHAIKFLFQFLKKAKIK